ncbi:SMI1/KNR4 family protein [Dactylosporangium sp. NPDC005555]|uniref:SMI1/KNR4 family protein n=1 Tax=Dactylosporangium sp. NPDC005555 TaxID=3154889 RepID=UPI0033A80631
MATVDEYWQRILNLIEDGDPEFYATFRPPPPPRKVDALERRLRLPIPADLHAWWRCSDGVDVVAAGLRVLIPDSYLPMPIDKVIEWREQLLNIAFLTTNFSDLEYQHLVERYENEPAGTPNGAFWLPSRLPFALNGGGVGLFIDLRAGPLHGCVVPYFRDSAGAHSPRWTSVLEMVTEVADYFEN